MGLSIYSEENLLTPHSTDGSLSNPVFLSVDSEYGGVQYKKLFVRNDDPLFTYTDITVLPVALDGTDIVSGAFGYSMKVLPGDTRPSELTWGSTDTDVVAELGDLPNTGTYLAFWVRVECPLSGAVEAFTKTKFVVTGTQNPA